MKRHELHCVFVGSSRCRKKLLSTPSPTYCRQRFLWDRLLSISAVSKSAILTKAKSCTFAWIRITLHWEFKKRFVCPDMYSRERIYFGRTNFATNASPTNMFKLPSKNCFSRSHFGVALELHMFILLIAISESLNNSYVFVTRPFGYCSSPIDLSLLHSEFLHRFRLVGNVFDLLHRLKPLV